MDEVLKGLFRLLKKTVQSLWTVVYLLDREQRDFAPARSCGLPSRYRPLFREMPLVPGKLPLLKAIIHKKQHLLIPDAGGRGRGVLSGKVYEYIAVGRPILAAVPPDGAAADLIRETGAGVVVPPDDVDAIRGALEQLHHRFATKGLPDVELADDLRQRLSRRARVEEMAELLRAVV